METVVIAFLLASSITLVAVPRAWAPLPFIMTACYLSISQSLEVGPFTFTAIRVLIAVGIIRVVLRGERLAGGMHGLDWLIVAWSAWACVSALLHENPLGELTWRLGLVYNTAGIYFLLRVFCSSIEDVVRLSQATAIVLLPLAVEMLYEKVGGFTSLFYVLEGNPTDLRVRDGRVRALGPFAHPILAGTVGAVSLPMMVGMWNRRRVMSCMGILACLCIIACSASSGPILSALAALFALAMWRYRSHMKQLRWLAVLTYVALALAMKAPVYYLIGRVDVAGGSTGWHRARLIDSAIADLGAWWIAGTDYTRDWAPSPGPTPNHTDITSQYLMAAVLGGLPLLFLFIAGLAKGFSIVGKRLSENASVQDQFVLWALGAGLFAHAATLVSVSYFDQSFVFLYVVLAAIGSARLEVTAGSDVRIHENSPNLQSFVYRGPGSRAGRASGSVGWASAR